MILLHHTRSSCLELGAVSVCFQEHAHAGKGSAFGPLQGLPGVLKLLAEFLLQPPQFIEDRFLRELAGKCIQLEDQRRTVKLQRMSGLCFRCDVAAAGFRKMCSGMGRWTARCTGSSFAIGVIANASWATLMNDATMDWSFVGGGFGSGFGLVKRNGSFFATGCMCDESAEHVNGRSQGTLRRDDDDRAISGEWLSDAEEFSVILDIDRRRVFFEADGFRIPGSGFENLSVASPYSFIASVPDSRCSVTLLSDPSATSQPVPAAGPPCRC